MCAVGRVVRDAGLSLWVAGRDMDLGWWCWGLGTELEGCHLMSDMRVLGGCDIRGVIVFWLL